MRRFLTMLLCIVLTLSVFTGCSTEKKETKEDTKKEEVVKKDPLTLESFDKRFKESSYYKNMSAEDTKVTTKIADDASKYTVTMNISGTKYKTTLTFADGKLTGKLSQDASGYLTYMLMNYFANDTAIYFGQPRGVVDYMFSTVSNLGTVGDYDKYGIIITDNEISISLNNMDFKDYKVTALTVSDDALDSAISANSTSDKEANITDDSPISVSNGFISLTTNNSDKNVYELNLVALTKNEYDIKQAVYDTIIKTSGYYNNGDSEYMKKFLADKKDLEKSKKSEDSKLELIVNDEEKVNSVVEYNKFAKDEFTVYTVKINKDLVTPVSKETKKK